MVLLHAHIYNNNLQLTVYNINNIIVHDVKYSGCQRQPIIRHMHYCHLTFSVNVLPYICI